MNGYILINVPNYLFHANIRLPVSSEIALVGFAGKLEAFEDEHTYTASARCFKGDMTFDRKQVAAFFQKRNEVTRIISVRRASENEAAQHAP